MMHWGRAVSLGTAGNNNSSAWYRRHRRLLLTATARRSRSLAAGTERGLHRDVVGPSTARKFSVESPPRGPLAGHGRLLLPKQAPFIENILLEQQQQQQQRGVVSEKGASTLGESFRETMMKERRPLQFLGVDTAITAGSICGHTSLGILACCYVQTDAFTIRELVICGSSLNLFFSYYRSQPLWISIKWNALFLAINATLIALMYKESADAEDFLQDPELARIFEDIFVPVDMTASQFMQLMNLAQRRAMLRGNDLNQEGRPHEEMFLIVEGTAEVKSEGEAVCHLEPGGFVGSMAFNRLIQESPTPSHGVTYSPMGVGFAGPRGDGDDGGDGERLHDVGDIGGDRNAAFESSTTRGGESFGFSGRGVIKAMKESLLNLLRGDSVVGNVAMSLVPDVADGPQDITKLERSKNTVTATSDAVVYVWNQHALRAFIKRRPLVGSCLQKAISEDFVNKVDQSRGHKKRYRLLLEEVLEGGEINVTEKKKLHRYRRLHGISLEEHKDMLQGGGWTEEDFEAGFQQGVGPRQGSRYFVEYEELVRRELASGEVKPESKLLLLNFRKRTGIDPQEHLLALEKQGWTADDYEVGVKDMPADFGQGLRSFQDDADMSDSQVHHHRLDSSSDSSSHDLTSSSRDVDDSQENREARDKVAEERETEKRQEQEQEQEQEGVLAPAAARDSEDPGRVPGLQQHVVVAQNVCA